MKNYAKFISKKSIHLFKPLLFLFLAISLLSCEEEDDSTSWDCASGDCIELFSDFGVYSSKSNCESECGGNADNSGLGNVAFWTNQDYGCGNIEVNLEGVGTDIISGFYENGFPGCDMNLNANFSVPQGNYFYTASCDGFEWPRREITIDECTGVQLSL